MTKLFLEGRWLFRGERALKKMGGGGGRARMLALSGLALRAEPFGALLQQDGTINRTALEQVFDNFDTDGNGFIDAGPPTQPGPAPGTRVSLTMWYSKDRLCLIWLLSLGNWFGPRARGAVAKTQNPIRCCQS